MVNLPITEKGRLKLAALFLFFPFSTLLSRADSPKNSDFSVAVQARYSPRHEFNTELERRYRAYFQSDFQMKIGILISGRGSNMAAIIEAVQSGLIFGGGVAVVISDKTGAEGLLKAEERGVETVVITKNRRTREEHDAEIVGELQKRGVELVCLAGYMRLLSKNFVRAFPNKIINIHPSLLPSFKGLDAQKQAIDYGVKISGCTVHFVDEDLDHGAIILQKAVEVSDDDTAESLAAKILAQEHALYVEAIGKITADGLEVDGRRVVGKKKKT